MIKMRCCVPFCKSTTENVNTVNRTKSVGITFHIFPSEKHEHATWLRALGKQDCHLLKSAVVCSKHFLSEDMYETQDGFRQIRNGAVPSTVLVCMVCLETESKLFSLSRYKLEKLYENLTGNTLYEEGNFKQTVCVECGQRLVNFGKFRDKSLQAHSLMMDLINKHELIYRRHIKMINPVTNKLKSSIVRTVLEPNHCDLHIIDNNEDSIQTNTKTEYEGSSYIQLKSEVDNENYNSTSEMEYQGLPIQPKLEMDKNHSQNNDAIHKVLINSDITSSEMEYEHSSPKQPKSEVEDGYINEEEVIFTGDNMLECEGTLLAKPKRTSESNNDYRNKNLTTLGLNEETSQINRKRNMNKDEGPIAVQSIILDKNVLNESLLAAKIGMKLDPALESSQYGDAYSEHFIKANVYNMEAESDHPTVVKGNTAASHIPCVSLFNIDNRQSDLKGGPSVSNSQSVVRERPGTATRNAWKVYPNEHRGTPVASGSCSESKFYRKAQQPLTITRVTAGCGNSCNDPGLEGASSLSSTSHPARGQAGRPPTSSSLLDRRAFIKSFTCDLCTQIFSKRYMLVRHMRTHTGEKPFACSLCNHKCSLNSSLVKHMRTHTDEKPYYCEFCDCKFRQRSDLVAHLRTHTGEKPFSCELCNSKFRQKSSLMLHLRTHSGEKPFSCGLCDSKFSQKNNLTSHLRTHTGEKPFSCGLCDSKFRQEYFGGPFENSHG